MTDSLRGSRPDALKLYLDAYREAFGEPAKGVPELSGIALQMMVDSLLASSEKGMQISDDLVLSAIDSEPELPGEMPDEMWESIKGDRDAVANAMRIAVRQTKEGIRDRFLSTRPERGSESK